MATSTVGANQKTVDPRKELLTAIDGLARRGGISRDKAITAWYATTLLGVDEDDAIDAASVDGPEDGGCDFIYIDDDQESIYVLQGYVADRSERAAGLKKWNSLVGAVANIKDPISFKLAGRVDVYDRLKDSDVSAYTLVFGLVSLAAKSDQIARQRESATRSKAYGSDITFFYEHQESLYDKYLIARAADRTVPEDSITFSGSVAELRGEFGQAIVGTVTASELARLHQKHKNQLFEGNVRLFIGERKGGINEKMVETAGARPGDFWALNNGITIVANSFEGTTENRYLLRQFSIVNGCQTTVSLSRAIEQNPEASKSQVLVRVVAARKTLLTDIVRYNNTQNPVKLSAVRLLDPIQEALRSAFSTIDYVYAPKQEGARLVKSPKRIDLEKIAQYLAAMSEETILDALRRKLELFDRSYKLVFPRGIRAEKVFLAWLLALEIETQRTAMLGEHKDSDDVVMKAILGINGTPWGIFVASTLIDKSESDLSKLTLQRMTTAEFKSALAKYASKALEQYSEIAINIVTGDEASEDVRNDLRIRPFLEKLKRNLSLRMSKTSNWKLPKLHMVVSS